MIITLREKDDLNIFVGVNPHEYSKKHVSQNTEWLKCKLDAGVSELITYFFFEVYDFF